jgi:hypothetical protein
MVTAGTKTETDTKMWTMVTAGTKTGMDTKMGRTPNNIVISTDMGTVACKMGTLLLLLEVMELVIVVNLRPIVLIQQNKTVTVNILQQSPDMNENIVSYATLEPRWLKIDGEICTMLTIFIVYKKPFTTNWKKLIGISRNCYREIICLVVN